MLDTQQNQDSILQINHVLPKNIIKILKSLFYKFSCKDIKNNQVYVKIHKILMGYKKNFV